MATKPKQILLKLLAVAHPAHLMALCKRVGYAFMPVPLRSVVWNEHVPAPKKFSTSYLNGLRGITAVKVFTFHYFMAFTDFTHTPYRMDDRHNNLMLFPAVRYVWTGFTSQVFFGIAGYLTCLRLFQLLDSNDSNSQAKVFSIIATSLFRRAFRLFLPVALITLIMATYIHLGFYEGNRRYIDDDELFPGCWNETKPPMFPTFGEQIEYWIMEIYRVTEVTSPGTVYPEHDQHLWSILAEMRASLHLYVCLVMLSSCKRHARLVGLCILMCLFYIWNRWETWVYILGAIVAQLDIILSERRQNTYQHPLPRTETMKEDAINACRGIPFSIFPIRLFLPQSLTQTKKHFSSRILSVLRSFFYLLSFYFMSFPIDGSFLYAPGYETLKSFIPDWVDRKDKVYPNVGTGILLFLLARSHPERSKCRRILMSRVAQYLGTISFAMYLVHGPLLHMFGYMIPHRIWWYFGVDGKDVGNTAWLGAIVVGYIISLTASWAVADIWSREIEGRILDLVKRLEGRCFKAKPSRI